MLRILYFIEALRNDVECSGFNSLVTSILMIW